MQSVHEVQILKYESTPKSPINWILSGVEGCKHLLIRTLRLRSVSGFPLNCLFGADSNIELTNRVRTADGYRALPNLLKVICQDLARDFTLSELFHADINFQGNSKSEINFLYRCIFCIGFIPDRNNTCHFTQYIHQVGACRNYYF